MLFDNAMLWSKDLILTYFALGNPDYYLDFITNFSLIDALCSRHTLTSSMTCSLVPDCPQPWSLAVAEWFWTPETVDTLKGATILGE